MSYDLKKNRRHFLSVSPRSIDENEISLITFSTKSCSSVSECALSADLHNKVVPQRSIRHPSLNSFVSSGT